MSDHKMSLREYREYAQAKHGKKSVNETTLKMIEQSVGSSGSREAFDRANGAIKIAQTLESERRK